MSHEIATATKCKLCGKAFYGPANALGGKLVPGDETQPRFLLFLNKLFDHLSAEHKQVYKIADVAGKEFQGWLILSYFETLDAEVLDQRNYFRWRTHQKTLQCTAKNLDVTALTIAGEFLAWTATKECTDELLKGVRDGEPRPATVIQLNLAARIQSALEELRGLLEEPNLYPTPPEELPPP